MIDTIDRWPWLFHWTALWKQQAVIEVMRSAGLLKQHERYILKENLGKKKGCSFVPAVAAS